MAPPGTHPRRSYNLYQSPPSLNTTNTHDSANAASPRLQKGATFHSPSSPSTEHDPILNIPSLPKRSATTLKELENLAASGSDRIAKIIGAVDRSLSGLQSFASESQNTVTADALPIPSFMVNAPSSIRDEDLMDIDQPPAASPRARTRKHHASDSGIGSSVSDESIANKKQGSSSRPTAADSVAQTGINGTNTLAAELSTTQQHVLGEYACRQIQKHIILPIIREEKLKAFHPLVSGLPYRIARKEISCLRDLEKVLLWLAPLQEMCIHATVEHLNDRDQRRPTDRPYTNGYFVDLVEQVRQYAAHLAATRSRMGPNDRVDLVGGLGRSGRPAELVRTSDGKTISLRTGKEVSAEEFTQGLKRSSAEIEEDLERSMARRKKNAPAVKEVQKCSECNKVFKRPCDLTKHEKTHSRPWKCSESNCKYYEYGWPTEKERDRHVNDKHSAAPSMFKCKFLPCPYESKRESNCKQHMEKAHGWTYVRSKNNGKSVLTPRGHGVSPPTPVASTPGSHIFNAPTPELRDDVSHYGTPASSHYRTESINGSVITSSDTYQTDNMNGFDTTFGNFNDFSWDSTNAFNTTGMTQFTAGNDPHRQSWDSAMDDPNVVPSAFNVIANEDESIFGPNFDWSSADLTSMNLQLATPAMSVEQHPIDFFNKPEPLNLDTPSLSPNGQGDAMLYSPYSMNSAESHPDEGYGGDYTQDLKSNTDFGLFDNTAADMTVQCNDNMFPDLSQFAAGQTGFMMDHN